MQVINYPRHKQEVQSFLGKISKNQLIHLQQTREQVGERLQIYQDKMKMLFDKKAKEINFAVGDLVVKWDKHREDPRKHGNFDSLWSVPFIIEATEGKNAFSFTNLQGESIGLPVTGRYI